MKASHPKQFKSLGRMITGFDEKIWNQNKTDIVIKGNTAKFSQNQELKYFLLCTNERILVEASPCDNIWGRPSAYIVSKAREDFPEPDNPVMTISLSLGSSTSIFFKLFTLAPFITRIQLLAPIVRNRKGKYEKELESARKSGFVRVRIDGIMYELTEEIKLEKNKKHNIEIVVDRLIIKKGIESRITDSLETVFKLTDGLAVVDVIDGEEMIFSQNFACPEHNISIGELEPVMFSFNNPVGACPKCTGLGMFRQIEAKTIVPNKDLSILEGAITAHGWNSLDETSIAMMYYKAISKHYNIPLDIPIKELTKEQLDIFLYGTGETQLELRRPESLGGGKYKTPFEGVIRNLERRYRDI